MKIRETTGRVRDLTAEELAQLQADREAVTAKKAAADEKHQLTLDLLKPFQGPVQLGTVVGELNIIKAYLRKLVEDGRI